MKPPTLTPRSFAESPEYLGLTLSPLIAAVMDAIAGIKPTTITDAECITHFGCPLDALPLRRHRILALKGGLRGGKSSRVGIPLLLWGAWCVPAPDAIRGEILSAPIVCPDLDLAAQSLSYASGYIDGSPVLRAARIDEDKDSITLRRPWDKRLVRIERRAASRGGRTGRARSITSALLDESAFFRDLDSGVVNDTEVHRPINARLLAGGIEAIVSTPWLAHSGLLESYIDRDFGVHTHALAVHAGTRALNPNWDPTGELEATMRAEDPENAEREIDAKAVTGGATTFFDEHALTLSIDPTRPIELAPSMPDRFGQVFGDCGPMFAGVDIGLVRDSSSLVLTTHVGGLIHLAHTSELHPQKGAPLSLAFVVSQFAATLKRYGVDEIVCDAWYKSEIEPKWNAHGIRMIAAPGGQSGKALVHVTARTAFNEGRIRLPKSDRLVQQLRAIVSKPAVGGGVTISSPRSKTAAHGDVASAFVLAVYGANGFVDRNTMQMSEEYDTRF